MDITDDSKFSTIILKRILVTHNLVLTIIAALLIIYLILRYSFLEILVLLFCRRGRNSKILFDKTKESNILMNRKIFLNLILKNYLYMPYIIFMN